MPSHDSAVRCLKDVLSKGSKSILLNLANVDYIDSSGWGQLVAGANVKNQGGKLKLLSLTAKVHDLLQIAKLYTVLDTKATGRPLSDRSRAEPQVRIPAKAASGIPSGRGFLIFRWMGNRRHPESAIAD
jgi:anti-anti-sigma factor